MDKQNINCEDEISVTIEIEDSIKECFIVAFPKSEYGSYIALLPKENKYFESGKLLLFKFIENDNSIPSILGIEDDAEYEYADDLLNEIIDDQVYLKLIEKYKDKFK